MIPRFRFPAQCFVLLNCAPQQCIRSPLITHYIPTLAIVSRRDEIIYTEALVSCYDVNFSRGATASGLVYESLRVFWDLLRTARPASICHVFVA
jgi:hypothetical protein